MEGAASNARARLDPVKFIGEDGRLPFPSDKGAGVLAQAFDHQGINSVLVMEGVPMTRNAASPYAFAKVLEEHPGDSVALPAINESKCKIESA